MTSTSIVTVVKMMESLPENVQEQLVEHLRGYLADIKDEMQWEASFKKSNSKLISAARRAKQEISEGLAVPMEYNNL
jgi:hypothetical protein